MTLEALVRAQKGFRAAPPIGLAPRMLGGEHPDRPLMPPTAPA